MAKSTKILVIPDSHACPYFDLERFSRLGKFANKVKPTHIVQMGDWAEMFSLNKYNVGHINYEGARIENDIAASVEALDRFEHTYKGKARRVSLMGNHENYISKAVNHDPKMYGMFSLKGLQWEEYGWEVVPFLDYACINGVKFIHFVPNKMGKAVASKYLASKIIEEVRGSVVVGHSHTFDIAYHPVKGENRKQWGVVSGYYGHPEHAKDPRSSWATGGKEYWTHNVVILDNVENGEFTLTYVRQEDVG